MVEQQTARLDAIFHALSDPTRRAILKRLAQGESSIGDLASPFHMTFAGASKHIRALEKAGLVRRRIEGRTHLCRLEPKRLAEAFDWLGYYERFWTMRLDDLERELRKPEKPTKRSKR
ncbi:MAG TPA: metalloregulator ArsR/SmtB family transcription factor [Methyloceanibacter sp.]|nr:metalloregulator ArsR/SmtB family transcription factor [Methyloceanibacter sp.]